MLLKIPIQPWIHVSMDFVLELPRNRRDNDSLLMVVDGFSKMTYLITSKKITVQQTHGSYTSQGYYCMFYHILTYIAHFWVIFGGLCESPEHPIEFSQHLSYLN